MTLNHERSGEGPTLVLIHGLGGAHVVWEPVIELLAPHRDVIAVDLPGFGGSDALHLASLGVERPHVAGNSLGAWTALEIAADGNASSVCCISPAGLWGRALGPRAYNTRKTGRRLRSLVSAALRSERGRRALMGTTVAHPERLSPEVAIEWMSTWLDAPSYDDANLMMRKTPFERAGEVHVPVTIAWGERDRLVRPPQPERMPSQTRYFSVPGWGHTPTYDDPEGVARVLLEASARQGSESPLPGAPNGHGCPAGEGGLEARPPAGGIPTPAPIRAP
jgi:pimeloyl-ACP methyl ester carboxylesterase